METANYEYGLYPFAHDNGEYWLARLQILKRLKVQSTCSFIIQQQASVRNVPSTSTRSQPVELPCRL
jgi:hypothetical protein